MNILYATSNQHKIESANKGLKSFNIKVEGIVTTDIKEIQSADIEEISIDKAKQAYEQVKKPLIVSDSGWEIPALNGFPGPMMAYVNRWFTSEDFLNLMAEKEDKTIILQECVTYIDGEIVNIFDQKVVGHFLDHAEGDGTNLDQVVTFREDEKSVAICQNENLPGIDQSIMWNKLGEFLSE